ncbi:MAG: (Fe-S)-binding protein [Chitinispirillia bacterium]|jgi:Fe-S oxidoreductase
MVENNTISLDEIIETPLRNALIEESSWKADLNYCMACGKCASICPLHGYTDIDPRKAVRMVVLGDEKNLINNDFIFQCTGCDKCTLECPMGVKIGNMITRARSMRIMEEKPGKAQLTCDLHRDKGNNMQIPTEEWIETVEWMEEELQSEIPDLKVPFDKKGAKYFATINSKLPMYHPMELQYIYKVFHAAQVNWTMPTIWWEGTNYCMFSGDLQSWENNLRKQVEHLEELGCQVMAYTECGHGYFATVSGYEKFNIKPNFKVVHVVNLYAKWIREGRFKLDPSRNKMKVTLHDPCNASRKSLLNNYPNIMDDARYVLDNVCADWVEMWPNREYNYCCSGGGGALISGFAKARNYYGQIKVEQIDRTDAKYVCTPCVNCVDGIDGLAKEYKRTWKAVHLWKLLANAIVLE